MLNQALIDLLWEGTLDTIYMTLVSTFFSYVFGMIMAVILVITRADGIRPHPVIFHHSLHPLARGNHHRQ